MNHFINPKLPKRIQELNDIAFNLSWSWHHETRKLFKSLDRPLWKATVHNPVKLLNQIEPYRLVAAAQDVNFLKAFDTILARFRNGDSTAGNWCQIHYPWLTTRVIAYFSMEFAIHSSLPLYAGGLGVLAGDYCKEASDLGLPIIGVGFMYPQGYFRQRISEDGWQEEDYRQLNFNESPLMPVLDSQNRPVKISVSLDSRPVFVTAWQVNVGNAKLYLLDTHLDENQPVDRELSARLYGGNSEERLKQEIVLGIGGVRLLRELKIDPAIWHANEGHTAFMMIERCRELVTSGFNFAEALQKVQDCTVFTTHTPIPAGNDSFPSVLIDKYFSGYYGSLGLNRAQFCWLGMQANDGANFNMSVLSLKTSRMCNGVSRLHGSVCRQMWHGLWPEVAESNVPILSITNGVHVPTWISPQMANLYSRYLGNDWLSHHDEESLWNNIQDIPAEEIWRARRWLKIKMINTLQHRARENWRQSHCSPAKVLATGALLDSEALTIGFCRRFTDYKRPWLILYDICRLKRILHQEMCPLQIIFAGKAHPNDHQGKILIQQVYNLARDPESGGRIVLVEDYDLHLSRYLVQGVDLWLNTPRRLQEASGTSGMKAALNGVPNLSVMDGWWFEAYNGANGWAINSGNCASVDEQDRKDALDLYALLENTIVPLYYDRDRNGIPHGWIRVIKESIRSNAPLFSARRMLKEYIELTYLPLAALSKQGESLLSSARGLGGKS